MKGNVEITNVQYDFLKKVSSIAQTYLPEKISLEEANREQYKNVFPYAFLTKYIRTYNALLLLIHEGYSEDSAVLLRSLFEIRVKLFRISNYQQETTFLNVIQYLRSDNQGIDHLRKEKNDYSSKDYLKDEIQNEQSIRYYIDELKKISITIGEELEKEYKSNANNSTWWPQKTIYQLLKDTPNELWLYEPIYKQASNILHSNTGILLPLYFTKADDYIFPLLTSDDNKVVFAFVASGMLIELLGIINSMYMLARDSEIVAIGKEQDSFLTQIVTEVSANHHDFAG